jgi:hypothetical protein
MAPSILGSSVWKLLHVALPGPRISRGLLNFWKICKPLLSPIQGLHYLKCPNIVTGGTEILEDASSPRALVF